MNEIQFLMYDPDEKIEVVMKDETILGTQKAIAELFDVVVSVLENTTKHGAIEEKTQTKQVKFYNLDAIISVGYRVNSQKATKFRI